MDTKKLTTYSLALGLFLAVSAHAENSNRYSWWERFFGAQYQSCHTHSNNAANHYWWTRYFFWHHHCPNESPIADAGNDQTATSGETIHLNGTASSDSDGHITRYRWRQVSGPRVKLRRKRTATPHFISPDVTQTEELVFVLKVRDNARGRDRDRVTITINPEIISQPPVANAGINQVVDEETLVQLDGSNSSDPDNDIVNYLWEQSLGTAVTLTDADTAIASFTAPELATAETLVFNLTVTDSQGNTDTDSTEVSVEPVIPVSQANIRIRSIDGSLVSDVNLSFYVDGVLRNDLSTSISDTATLMIDADTNYSIKTSVDGFADQIIPYRSAAEGGNNDLNITLLPYSTQLVIPEGSFSLAEDDLSLRGVAVSGNTTDFVDTNGNPVTGDIELAITLIDPNAPAALAAFPGKFAETISSSGNESPIYSWAAVDFKFSANGNPINLAPSATAEVSIPLFYFTNLDRSHIRSGPFLGDAFYLYSLAENTSTWQEVTVDTVSESTSSRTGFALRALVNNFSWFNVESVQSKDTAQLQATVLATENGTATLFSRTEANFGFHLNQADTTISINSTSNPLTIPANVQTCIWAKVNFDDGSLVATEEQCVTPADDESVSLTFTTGSGEPLDVFISSHDTGTNRTIYLNPNSPIKPIILSPASVERQVSYVSTGNPLPSGVNLSAINDTQAELVGISRSSLSRITVLATDDENNTDEIIFNLFFRIDGPRLQPPLLPDQRADEIIDRRYFAPSGAITESLDTYNSGGTATSWTTSEELPPWIRIFTTSANRSFITTNPFHSSFPARPCATCSVDALFESEITASNDEGHSSTKISVYVQLPPL